MSTGGREFFNNFGHGHGGRFRQRRWGRRFWHWLRLGVFCLLGGCLFGSIFLFLGDISFLAGFGLDSAGCSVVGTGGSSTLSRPDSTVVSDSSLADDSRSVVLGSGATILFGRSVNPVPALHDRIEFQKFYHHLHSIQCKLHVLNYF